MTDSDVSLKRGLVALALACCLASSNASYSAQLSPAGSYNFPGGIAQLRIDKLSKAIPTVRYGLHEPAIIEHDNYWNAYIGLDLGLLPGEYVIYVKQEGADSGANIEFKKFRVEHKTFPLKAFNSDIEGAKVKQNAVTLPELGTLSDLGFSNSQPPSLPFDEPFHADWNLDFGYLFLPDMDAVNAISQNYSYAIADGLTLVKSPQAGIISKIHSDNSGYSSVVIDHGRGIFSIIHGIDDLAVEVGNGVVANAVIGKVPSYRPLNNEAKTTGTRQNSQNTVFWQVQMNGVFVNPMLMTKIQ